jgi:hypothetical protein
VNFKTYYIEWPVGKKVRKVLVLDERRRGIKQLPKPNDPKKIEEVCKEIEILKKENKSWREIADIYNKNKSSIKHYYRTYCKDKTNLTQS